MSKKLTCPHMSGGGICSICRELLAYRICWDGTIEAMKDSNEAMQTLAKMMEATFQVVWKACLNETADLDGLDEMLDEIFKKQVR